MIIAFFIIVLIFSVIIHEISHGYIALMLGDKTALLAGRLTLNPLKHIDLFGSILLPLILAISGAPVFGWAKPVPYNPMFLKNPKKASGLIAVAGPASNLLVAGVFGLLVRLVVQFPGLGFSDNLFLMLNMIVLVNISLAVFNLLPVPPLDGSGVLFSLLPYRYAYIENLLRQYGMFILILILITGASFISPVISGLHKLLTGVSFF
ncbi:MAG: site-2 protease family protein [Candidatus Harrisonbacteria bacterium CG10_big_fil_rev_8_21_14_0_10_38_8]|uniref:Site-2 protease family protein n=1 Tax=Candidatus Harrisonbacteria bacterium CG10_big_fil_rev_8_21_14_0_10_38_8 TaxID=1974582 RepID=A0A2M6WKI7_9BACT|nr:MAG: site-2 protease family protein [Candidatus Harrisonbacteria bacterium CG10_big_fil_rev_8_21_14_0_10_38_8]